MLIRQEKKRNISGKEKVRFFRSSYISNIIKILNLLQFVLQRTDSVESFENKTWINQFLKQFTTEHYLNNFFF